MKLIILSIAFLFSVSTPILYGQTAPEKVHSIVKIYKEHAWYTTQFKLWEKETLKDPKNENAWENLYVASRMAKLTTENQTEIEGWSEKMQNVIVSMEKAIPNTYIYYYIKVWDYSIWSSQNKEEIENVINYAKKAYAIKPNSPAIYPDLMNYYMLKGDDEKLKEIAIKWRATTDIATNTYTLNYNMLMSAEKNSFLLTAGDNDTYPSLVLQYAESIRPDIQILNIFIAAASEEYRNNAFKKAGIPLLSGNNLDQMAVINHIIKHKKEKPLCFAFGNYFNEIEALKDNLYNVGLGLRYSENNFNNTSVLINNFENKFLLNHLVFSFDTPEFPEQVKRHNLSYIPGLMMLYEHYKLSENDKKSEETWQLILKVIKNTSYEDKIKKQC